MTTVPLTIGQPVTIGGQIVTFRGTPAPIPGNQAPAASFSTDATYTTVTVDATSSTDPDGTITAYIWAWGDGTSGTGATTTHTYAAGGVYTIGLTVIDNAGQSTTTTTQVTVQDRPIPTADFTVTVDGSTVTVDGTNSGTPGGQIVSYSWDFGDGTTTTGATAQRTYTTDGVYTITLTVTTDVGTFDTDTEQVTIGDPDAEQPLPAPATVTATPDHATMRITVVWAEVAGAVSYEVWEPGTVDQSGQPVPVRTYPAGTTQHISGPLGGTRVYAYSVRAVAASGLEGAFRAANEVTFDGSGEEPNPTPPPPAAPNPPALAVPTVNGDDVTLTWTPAGTGTTPTGYLVYRRYDAETGTYDVIASNVTTTTYTDLDREPGTWWYYVRAYDTVENLSAPSNTRSVTVAGPDPTIPPAPAGVVSVRDDANMTITTSWTPTADAHEVEEDGNSWIVPAGISSRTSGQLAGTRPYTYSVRALRNGVPGPWTMSNTVTFDATTPDDPDEPTPPPPSGTFVLGTTEPVAANTGVGVLRAAPTQVHNGNLTIGSGQTVRDLIINGYVDIHYTATMENCLVRGPSAKRTSGQRPVVRVNGLPSSLSGVSQRAQIRYCTISLQTPSDYWSGIGYKGFYAYRCLIEKCTDSFSVYSTTSDGIVNVLIEGCFSPNMTGFRPDNANSRAETHNDSIQLQGNRGGVNDVIVRGCSFNARHSTTTGTLPVVHRQIAAIMQTPNTQSRCDATYDQNWLRGGEFQVNLAGSGTVRFTNNRQERPGTDSRAPIRALSVHSSISITATGNTYIDNGGSVPVQRG